MNKRAVLGRGGDKARRSSGRAPVKAAEGRGWARRVVRKWTKQPVVVGAIKLVKWRTIGDADLAASAAAASNQPLTRSLRSQLGYSLPSADSLADDLYSRNHSKKAALLQAHDAHRLGGRATHFKHEHSHAGASTADSHAQQQSIAVHTQVDAAGSVTVVLAAAVVKQEVEDDRGQLDDEEEKEADEDMAVKKEEGAEDGDSGIKLGVEDDEEDEQRQEQQEQDDEDEEKKEARGRRADKADEEMDAEDEKDDEEEEVEDEEKEQREDEQPEERKQHDVHSPQSPSSSSDSDFDADEPSPPSSRPLVLPPSDEPSLPSLLPLPSAASSGMPTPSPLLAVKDEDEVMRDMEAHTWEDEQTGSEEAQHELQTAEVDIDEHNASMADDV